MPVTNKPITLPTDLSRRLLSIILGFGVAVALFAAPFLGAKRIPGFEPLVSLFPEEQRTLLVIFSSFFIGLVALAVQFYAEEAIARKSLRKIFGVILLIVLASALALLVLHVSFVKKIYNYQAEMYETETIGWTRKSSCKCLEDSSARECIEGIAFNIEKCWSEGSITQVKLALFFSYLGAIEGFAVLAGLLVLRPPKRQMPPPQTESSQPQQTKQLKKETTRKRGTSKPADPVAKPNEPKTRKPAPRLKKSKPSE